MKLLALDTATLTASVAVLVDGRLVTERRHRVTTHSEALLGLLDGALAEAGLVARDLDGVVCGAGPGSFTGLRIGLATAKGLCFALGRPLQLVSSLEALAARAPDGAVCAVLDAHKNEVYAARYLVRAGVPEPLGAQGEQVLPPASLAAQLAASHAAAVGGPPLALVGDGALRYREILGSEWPLVDEDGAPHASDVARLGAAAFARGEAASLGRSGPRYIRPSEAEIAKMKHK
jgi:tRNA threonylcarbamoyladenosine biosynthesis protein TsaB